MLFLTQLLVIPIVAAFLGSFVAGWFAKFFRRFPLLALFIPFTMILLIFLAGNFFISTLTFPLFVTSSFLLFNSILIIYLILNAATTIILSFLYFFVTMSRNKKLLFLSFSISVAMAIGMIAWAILFGTNSLGEHLGELALVRDVLLIGLLTIFASTLTTLLFFRHENSTKS